MKLHLVWLSLDGYGSWRLSYDSGARLARFSALASTSYLGASWTFCVHPSLLGKSSLVHLLAYRSCYFHDLEHQNALCHPQDSDSNDIGLIHWTDQSVS